MDCARSRGAVAGLDRSLVPTLSDDLDQVAIQQGRDASAVMREAIADYIDTHRNAS